MAVVSVSNNRLIGPQQLPHRIKEANKWPTLKEYLHAREEAYLAEVIRFCDDDRERAAQIAGVRDIFESEAVSEAKEQLNEAEVQSDGESSAGMSEEAQEALEKLREELEVQENAVKEAKAMMQEREEFLEASENTLFEKVMAQQEKETELEQLTDDLSKREKALEEKEAALPG